MRTTTRWGRRPTRTSPARSCRPADGCGTAGRSSPGRSRRPSRSSCSSPGPSSSGAGGWGGDASTHRRAVSPVVFDAVSLARAARNPALEELYFFGPHPGNFAFEIGNANLGSEKALGFDIAARWRSSRVTGEISYFRNSIDDYIFRNPITEEEFDERFGHDAHNGDDEHGHGDEFGFIEFVAADSVLQGIEGHADIEVGRGFGAEIGADYVRGELRASNEPLPRIPPFRFRLGLNYQRNAFQAGGEVIAVSRQKRVFGAETPTAGYGNLRLFAAYSFGTSNVVNTLTARLDNATNELYRNHLSLIKDLVPEMGRNFKLLYSIRF